MTIATIFPAANTIGYIDVLGALDDDNSTPVNISTTNISASIDQFLLSVNGSFQFSGPELTGGLIQSINLTSSGIPIATLANLNLSIDTLISGSEREINEALNGGNDVITSAWNEGDIYETFNGDDQIQLGNGDDRVDGGNGVDRFILTSLYGDTKIDHTGSDIRLTGPQGMDLVRNVEIFQFLDKVVPVQGGTPGADRLVADLIAGLPDDLMFGGAGGDLINGGLGDDRIFGNGGFDALRGGSGNDWINGGSGRDNLGGDAGNDRLIGGGGGDMIAGGGGSDILVGQKGRDTLVGGGGNDTMTGGSGKDTFQFRKGNGSDTITDFEIGRDVITIGLGASRFNQLEQVALN